MNKRLVPRLRFKKFNDEWKHKQINKLLKIKNGRSQKKVETSNGSYPILATSGKIGSTNHYLYDGESVLIGRKGTINKPMYFQGRFWTVDTLFYSHLFNNSDGKFIFNLFKTINWLRYNTSSGIPSLTSKNIESINVNVPTLSEQQHIGSFFTKLDRMIELQFKKITYLKQLKKGYLQKMFPQKGKNVPRLRFDGFYNNLNKKKLKDICTSESSKHSLKQSKHYKIGKYPIFDVNGIIGYINNFDQNIAYISIIKDGSGVGKTKVHSANTSIINTMNYILPNANMNIYYLNLLLNTLNLLKYKIGTGIPHIYFNDYSNINILIPNLKEQIQIGKFFKNLDQSITQQDNKLTQLKRLKKAYLQKMFC